MTERSSLRTERGVGVALLIARVTVPDEPTNVSPRLAHSLKRSTAGRCWLVCLR